MKIQYHKSGDYYLPNLICSEASHSIGKYGRMRRRYLREHHPLLFSELLLTEQLYPHLVELDEACEGRMELLIGQMADREGITETLKRTDQMEWVRRMNGIRNRAEEIVLHELIYTEEAEDADT